MTTFHSFLEQMIELKLKIILKWLFKYKKKTFFSKMKFLIF